MNRTLSSPEGHAALHQSKLIPLGKKTPEKKEAVHKWFELVKAMLKANS